MNTYHIERDNCHFGEWPDFASLTRSFPAASRPAPDFCSLPLAVMLTDSNGTEEGT